MVDVEAPGRHSISQEQILEILLDKAKEVCKFFVLKAGIPLFLGVVGKRQHLLLKVSKSKSYQE